MLFVKNGIEVGVKNPVCYDLFIKQGWKPVKEKDASLEKTEKPIEKMPKEEVKNLDEGKKDKPSEDKVYKKGDFTTWSIKNITKLGEELGYTFATTKKADIINEFLAQQEK